MSLLECIAGLVGVKGYCYDEKELWEFNGKASNYPVLWDSSFKNSDDIYILSLLLPICLSKANRNRLLLDTSEILGFGHTNCSTQWENCLFTMSSYTPRWKGGKIKMNRKFGKDSAL